MLQIRGEYRELRESIEQRDDDITKLRKILQRKDTEIHQLEEELNHHRQENYNFYPETETERLRAEVRELREELSEVSMSEYEGIEDGRSLRCLHSNDSQEKSLQNIQNDIANLCENHQCPDVQKLLDQMNSKMADFEKERLTWREEKEKVIKYQRQLQYNYVQMFRRSRSLESQVENLTLELALMSKDAAAADSD